MSSGGRAGPMCLSPKQRTSIHASSAFVLLLSSVMLAGDHIFRENTLRQEQQTAHVLTSERLATLDSSISFLQSRVRAWLVHSGRVSYLNLTREELFKTPWKTTREGGESVVRADQLQSKKCGSAKKGAGIGLGPGPRKIQPDGPDLSDEALIYWEKAAVNSRRMAAGHRPEPLIDHIPGRDLPPGAVVEDYSKIHPLLAYSDDKYATQAVSEMVKAYGPATTGTPAATRTCDGDFGNELVSIWRQTKEEWCVPKGAPVRGGGGRAGGSRLSCYFIKQTEHGGAGDNLCVLENVSVDMRGFSDPTITDKVMLDYKNSQHADEAYVHWGQGNTPRHLAAQCEMDSTKYVKNKFPGWNEDWLWNGLEHKAQPFENLACQEWESTPTLIVQRDTFANMYHDSEDFVNAFLALAILELRLDQIQVFLTDLYPWGPFEAVWRQAFGFSRPALSAWDIAERYGKKRVCFEKLIIGIYGPASPFCIMDHDTKCLGSPLMRAYTDFVIRGMRLQRFAYAAQPKAPAEVLTISWLARRSSVQWPERSFCDGRYFKCNLFEHLNLRTLARVVTNEGEVLQGLRELASAPNAAGVKLFFMEADYNVLTFEQQMRYNLMTDILVGPHGAGLTHQMFMPDILVGPHGAGLTHQMFMPDRAMVIEIYVEGSSANRHFHNMARWRGRAAEMYQGVDVDNPVPVAKVTEAVLLAANKLAVNAY